MASFAYAAVLYHGSNGITKKLVKWSKGVNFLPENLKGDLLTRHPNGVTFSPIQDSKTQLIGKVVNFSVADLGYTTQSYTRILQRGERDLRTRKQRNQSPIFDFPQVEQIARRLPFVVQIFNTTKNAVTGLAPAQLLFGNLIDLDEGVVLPRSERPHFASLTDDSA